jgi:predicted alpha/beta-fold hydrolase
MLCENGDLPRVRPFEPLLRNPHALTILGNFWPRGFDFSPFSVTDELVQTDPDTQVRVVSARPKGEPIGEVVQLHGLEGGAQSGYMVSMAWTAVSAGFISHRFHMRTCGGTAHLAKTLYHAGLTSDLRFFLEKRRREGSELPIFLVGYSLGGNVALKMAGELGETDLIQGVVAVSTPIDLAACTRRIHELDNKVYEDRFVKRMRQRMLDTGRYTQHDIRGLDSIYLIDDRITAPSFGFGTADNYYATQSAQNFLGNIRVPGFLLQAKDDSFIPFDIYSHRAFRENPRLRLMMTDYGGHIGFLSRRGYRFWADEVVVDFLLSSVAQHRKGG